MLMECGGLTVASPRLGVVALTLVAIAGCTVNAPGEATTAPSSGHSTTSQPSTTKVLPSSTRPREVKMNGVNPCELLSADQLKRFAIDRPPSADKDTTFQTATCDYFSKVTLTGFRLTPIPTLGIDRFEPGKVTGDVQVRTVRGFPAREIHTPGASAGND